MEGMKKFEDLRPLASKVKVKNELAEAYMKTIVEFPDCNQVGVMREFLDECDNYKKELFDKKNDRYRFFDSKINKWLEIHMYDRYGKETDIFYFFPYDINMYNYYVFGLFSPKRTNKNEDLYESGLFERSFNVCEMFLGSFSVREVEESVVIANIENTWKGMMGRRYAKCGFNKIDE